MYICISKTYNYFNQILTMNFLKLKLSRAVFMMAVSASLITFQACNQPATDKSASTDDNATEVVATPEVEKQAPAVNNGSITMPANFTVAYVNTDSLMTKYDFYKDASAELQDFESKAQQQYEYTARKLQEDYDKYIEQAKAGMLTLKQQQDTEASLQEQQQKLMGMEQTLGQQSSLRRQSVSTQVTDTILSFLKTYRLEKDYTLILNYGSMSGLLSASEELDITDDVIERLNSKYQFDKRQR